MTTFTTRRDATLAAVMNDVTLAAKPFSPSEIESWRHSAGDECAFPDGIFHDPSARLLVLRFIATIDRLKGNGCCDTHSGACGLPDYCCGDCHVLMMAARVSALQRSLNDLHLQVDALRARAKDRRVDPGNGAR